MDQLRSLRPRAFLDAADQQQLCGDAEQQGSEAQAHEANLLRRQASTSLFGMTGEKTRLCGCISMATRTSPSRAGKSIGPPFQQPGRYVHMSAQSLDTPPKHKHALRTV
ncbi:hypothetical protein [Streptomyces sp. NPDC001401]|uniref:hypothetical protein n=1 Tax=Streptomyces sp. NPDC001401 TaxID=3364570 RepID=UPI00368EC778